MWGCGGPNPKAKMGASMRHDTSTPKVRLLRYPPPTHSLTHRLHLQDSLPQHCLSYPRIKFNSACDRIVKQSRSSFSTLLRDSRVGRPCVPHVPQNANVGRIPPRERLPSPVPNNFSLHPQFLLLSFDVSATDVHITRELGLPERGLRHSAGCLFQRKYFNV